MIPASQIIVALDTNEPNELKRLFNELCGSGIWVKIGMEIFYSLGPEVIHHAKDFGFKVFLDLKMHDIPHTVSQAIKALSRLDIDMINVHAAGGKEMMLKSAEALKSFKSSPLLIAVTQLTSTTQHQMNLEQSIPGPLIDSVLSYSQLAKSAGLDGVVCSPLEVQAIKKTLGQSFKTVTPGIRPYGTDNNDQKRVTTPREALELGTDFMVIGRPITHSPTPLLALMDILQGN